jgi:hypothetical protein
VALWPASCASKFSSVQSSIQVKLSRELFVIFC